MRDQTGKTAVDSVNIVALNMVVDLAVNGANHRGREDADLKTGRVEIEPDSIERSTHVAPIGGPDNTLVAKAEHLPAGDEINPAFGRIAQPSIRLPNVPNVLVGRCIRYMMIEEDSRILCDPD